MRELMRGQLAHQDGPSFIELGGRCRIRLWHAIEADFRMSRGADPCGVVDVLQGERDPVQRPAVPAAGDLRLGPPRLLPGQLEGAGDEGMILSMGISLCRARQDIREGFLPLA